MMTSFPAVLRPGILRLFDAVDAMFEVHFPIHQSPPERRLVLLGGGLNDHERNIR